MSLLVIRLSAIGDVILSLPTVRALARARPKERLLYLCDRAQVPLLEGQPGIDTVVGWPGTRRNRAASVASVRRQIEALTVAAGDPLSLIIDLQHKLRTIRLSRGLARRQGARVLSLARRSPSQAFLALFGHDPPRPGSHATRLYLEVLRPLQIDPPPGEGPLPIVWEVPDDARTPDPVGTLSAGPRVGLAPASRWPTKRWPESHFVDLAARLIEDGMNVVLVGGPDEAVLLDRIGGHLPAGRWVSTATVGLPALGATLARLSLLVTGDSGPAHLAAAVGCPVVALFGPTSPERWAPGPGATLLSRRLACQPCSNHGTMLCPLGHHDCLRGLSVDRVHAAALARLQDAVGELKTGHDA